jgi:cell wall-associated NlpC family hydrolase
MKFSSRIRRVLGISVLVSALVATGAVLGPAWAVPSYPTWAEVDAAKKSVAKKKTLIARFNAIIAEQLKEEDALSDKALQLGEIYNIAREELNQISAKVSTLQSQADAANEQANDAKARLAQIASQMYRNGSAGTGVSLFLNAGEADNLLYQLGARDRLATQNDTTYKKSVEKQRYAQSVTDQLNVAKVELAEKAKVAKAAYDSATSAASVLAAKIAENKAAQTTFYKQLASLQRTSADLERRRAEGLAAEARQNAGNSGSVLTAPALYTVQDADPVVVSKVLKFARDQIGERYVFGAAGMSTWDCSGLTMTTYKKAAGIYISWHSVVAQFRLAAQRKQLVPMKDRQPGDLIFYTRSSAFDGDKYHIAIYSGNNKMIEAPRPGAFVREVPMRWGELFPYAARPSA